MYDTLHSIIDVGRGKKRDKIKKTNKQKRRHILLSFEMQIYLMTCTLRINVVWFPGGHAANRTFSEDMASTCYQSRRTRKTEKKKKK
jgi:hypothetical protein